MDLTQLAAVEAAYAGYPVVQTIAPDDEMWPGGEPWYFDVGKDAMHNIFSGLGRSRLDQVQRILDLPCGHGRIGRHLRAGFPDAQLAFCDLNRSGVDFCSATFGGEPIYSQPELTDVTFNTKYDVVWIGSLFTHVDDVRAERWLRYLCECLKPAGLLIATFHGLWSIQVHNTYSPLIDQTQWDKILAGFEETGWGYANYPGQIDFGVSLAKPSRIVDMALAIADIRIVGYAERAWAGNHDVLTLTRTDRREPWITPPATVAS